MKNLDIENIEKVFEKVINSSEWKLLQSYFNKNKNIYLAGNGKDIDSIMINSNEKFKVNY